MFVFIPSRCDDVADGVTVFNHFKVIINQLSLNFQNELMFRIYVRKHHCDLVNVNYCSVNSLLISALIVAKYRFQALKIPMLVFINR